MAVRKLLIFNLFQSIVALQAKLLVSMKHDYELQNWVEKGLA